MGVLNEKRCKDFGCFFIKKKDDTIWQIFYCKTNYLLKKYPNYVKFMYFDIKKNEFREKNHLPNKIWGVFFDKNGIDYPMDKDVSNKEMEKMITKDSQEIYDFENYTNELELYEKMKETGLNKFYTKKWFKKQYDFIKNQFDITK